MKGGQLCMARRARWAGFLVVTIPLFASTAIGQQAAQPLPGPSAVGRYQYVDGGVTRVFDTHTGRIYTLFPRDDKAGTDAYITMMDPVNGQATRIDWKVKKP